METPFAGGGYQSPLGASNTQPAITLEFRYDGYSRRISKKTTIGVATPLLEGYLYDGWNLVMITQLNPTNPAVTPVRKWSCVWKPDVGSTLYARSSWQKAGGVGGLAWMQTGIAQTLLDAAGGPLTGAAEVHIPMTDHMGNVRHYYQIKATAQASAESTITGQVSASYEYDAFGREVRATGTIVPASNTPPGLISGAFFADALPFHFSTKFTDQESGLNYYGYRFYDPLDGRWLNRDPIEEWGGLNLMSFLENSTLNAIDVNGLDQYDEVAKQIDQGGREALKMAMDDLEKRQKQANGKNPPNQLYEFGGRVCRKCTVEANGEIEYSFYRTGPVTQESNGTFDPTQAPPCKDGDTMVGAYHNHPDSTGLSGFDPPVRDKNGEETGEGGYRGDKKIADRGKDKSINSPDGLVPDENKVPPRIMMGATSKVSRNFKPATQTDIYNPRLPSNDSRARFKIFSPPIVP